MKTILSFLLFASFLFIGCVEENAPPPQNIEEGADRAKDAIDKFSDKARKFLDKDNGKIDDVKKLIDSLASKSEGIKKILEERGPEIKEKLEEIKNDPKVQENVDKFKKDGKQILGQLEELINEIAKDFEENEK